MEAQRHYSSMFIPVEGEYPPPRGLINSHLFAFHKLMKWTYLGEPMSYEVLSSVY